MVLNREEAAKAALASDTNPVGYCQGWTVDIYHGRPVGDFDGDGDADAVDGWESEPHHARHPGDRKPPRGVPVAYGGGSHGYGHRAISLGHGKIRSTDAAGNGRVATVDLDWPEKVWGLHYLGWSETIDGEEIPLPPPPPPTRISRFHHEGSPWHMELLQEAVANGRHGAVENVLHAITHQVNRLRDLDKKHPNSRVRKFVEAYHNHNSLRMGLLNGAVRQGRHGLVEDVRDSIRHQLARLPRR